MRIVSIENPVTLLKCRIQTAKSIMLAIRDQQAAYLRRQFNVACVDATALAVIEVSEMLGFYDLAAEMKADFYTETGREAII